MRRIIFFAISSICSFSLGCSEFIDEVTPDDCTPGRQIACVCPGELLGVQACNETGDGYGFCECSGEPAFGADTSSFDDAGDADSSFDDSGSDDFSPAPTPDPAPAPVADQPEPLPDPIVELRDARIYVLVVGGSLTATLSVDWSVSGREDVAVDVEVMSNLTYRDWTVVASDLPLDAFRDISLPVTQGERRFDVRVVARDASGNRWESNRITIE